MYKTTKLASSVRFAVASTALATAAFAPLSFAQEADGSEAKESAERITVVGSRIRTDEFANDKPIDIITVDDAEDKGIKTLGELLRTSTSASGSSQITAALTVGYVTDGGTGTETVSLRGLGANRTLILINGRRAGPAGTRGSVSAFDLNSIPLSAVERVEVLKDGASALYGSDAVAGVINIITKKGDDKTITVDVSQPFESGGEDKRINMSFGEEFDKGSFRVTLDYRNTATLVRGDRDYLDCTERLQWYEDGTRSDPIDPRTGDYHCSETGYGLWTYGAGSSAYGGGLQTVYDYDGFFAANGYESINGNPDAGFTTPEGWYPVSYNDDYASNGWWDQNHPFLAKETLVPETTNISAYFTGEYNLTDEITAYAELIHSRRKTETDGYRQFWTADVGVVTADSLDGFAGDGTYFFPVALTDHYSSEIEVDYTRAVIGATGDIGFWTWDLSYQHSYSDGTYKQDIIYQDSMEMAQQQLLGLTCDGQTTEISGQTCVDIPWGDPQFLYGNHTAEQSEFLFGSDKGVTKYTQQTLEGFVTGDLFDLPAGTVGAAFGFQVQKDKIDDTPGTHTLNGNSWGLSSAGITKGDQTTKAVYAEFLVPVLSDLPGVESLDLSASAAYTDVDTFGSDTTYKLGANWQIADGYVVRASRGTSFRSPALFELYLSEQTGYGSQLSVDPCLDYVAEHAAGNISDVVFQNCQADGIPADYTTPGSSALLITSGGEGRLEAETSTAESIGFVFTSPEETYAFSIDYFKIEIDGEITSLGGSDIVNRCYNSTDFANEPLCDLFDRRDGANDDYGIDNVYGGYVNIAHQVARGVDYQFTYQDEFDFGSIRFSVEHTMQIERASQLFEDSEYDNNIGENGNPKHNGNARLTYSKDDFNVTWTATYFDSTNDYEDYASETNTTTVNGETVTFIDETPWTTYHTLSAGFSVNDFDIILGVANLFDKEPPRISSSGFELGNAALYSQYDFVGRRAFANIRYNF